MKPSLRVLFISALSLLLAVACVLPSGSTPQSPAPSNGGDAVGTIVAATLTAAAQASSGNPPAAATESPENDTIATMVAATLTAAAPAPQGNPPPADAPTGNLPTGVLVETQPGSLALYDVQGQMLATYAIPGGQSIGWDQIAIGGPAGSGQPAPPIFYTSYDNGGTIMVHDGQNASPWVAAPNIITLAGATAQPVIAYSLFLSPTSGYDTRSELYFGTLSNPPAQAVLNQINADGYAIYPLAVEAENGQPKGIWYTTQLYGIGDVSYAPRRGLYRYDCGSGAETIVLQPTAPQGDISPVGISTDFKWVAYTIGSDPTLYWQPTDGSQPAQSAGTLSPGSLGAGDASFSPNGLRVAWTTSNRTESGEGIRYQYFVQIHEISQSGAGYSQTGTPLLPADADLWRIEWLDNDTLLAATWNTPIYKIAPVSSLLGGTTATATPFLNGSYLAMAYGRP